MVVERDNLMLFQEGLDRDFTFSYVFTYFAATFDMMYDSIHVPIYVSTPVGESSVVD